MKNKLQKKITLKLTLPCTISSPNQKKCDNGLGIVLKCLLVIYDDIK